MLVMKTEVIDEEEVVVVIRSIRDRVMKNT